MAGDLEHSPDASADISVFLAERTEPRGHASGEPAAPPRGDFAGFRMPAAPDSGPCRLDRRGDFRGPPAPGRGRGLHLGTEYRAGGRILLRFSALLDSRMAM